MNLEEILRRDYDDHLGALDLAPGDATAARRTGARMRVRRRAVAGVAAVVVLVAGLAAVLPRNDHVPPSAPLHDRGSWHELPAARSHHVQRLLRSGPGVRCCSSAARRSHVRRSYGMSAYASPGSGHVVAYDPRRSAWSRYPDDTLRPSLGYPTLVGTPSGPVLVGKYANRHAYRGLPSTPVADVWTGRSWRRLPPTGQLESSFVWTGRRLVDPTPGTRYHGGADPWPHRYPYGGALDPATGEWSRLPPDWSASEVRFDQPPPGWDVVTRSGPSGPRFVVRGQVYDDDTRSAWLLPHPTDAPASFASAAWAGDRLVALGGANYDGQRQTGLSGRAWICTP